MASSGYDGGQLDMEDLDKCMFCNECVKTAVANGQPDLLSVHHNQDKFIFSLEVLLSIVPQYRVWAN